MEWLYVLEIMWLANFITADQPHIVIIGAGTAGIAAASKLSMNDFYNITILEAENRVGGRVYSTVFDKSWIDLGGQKVQGETNCNVVYKIASPLGLLEIPNATTKFKIYNSNGYELPNTLSDYLENFHHRVKHEITKNLDRNISSVGEYYVYKVQTELRSDLIANETSGEQLLKLYEGLTVSTDAADDWFDLSIMKYQVYSQCPGSNSIHWKERAYSTIIDILTKKHPNPEEELPILNNTLLNTEVINIDYQSMEGKTVIETSAGQKYVADHVIVTTSLGVLKEQYKTLFTPQLPEFKSKTIQGLGFGTTAKIYLTFEAPWWNDENIHFDFIWDDKDRMEYETDLNKKWLLDVVSFVTVPQRPRLLTGWVGGASSRYMETLTEDQVLNQTFALLNKFVGQTYNITRPTGIKRTMWYSNKHFRGAYSYRSVESEKSNVWAAQLAAPLVINDKPVILFAGEATSDHHFSTVNGAIESGWREANRLVDLYKNTANPISFI